MSGGESAIKRIPRRLVRAGIARRSEIRGCTPSEIAEIQSNAGGPLPRTYQAFLGTIGSGAGKFRNDIEMFYPDILDLKGWAPGLPANHSGKLEGLEKGAGINATSEPVIHSGKLSDLKKDRRSGSLLNLISI